MRNDKGSLWAGFAVGAVVAAAVIVAVVAVLRLDPTGKAGSNLGDPYIYDLAELRKVDPKLITHDLTATLASPFDDARAIAVGPAGRIYLAADNAIHVLPADLAETGFDAPDRKVIKAPGTPRCLAVDADGTIYAGIDDRVAVFSADETVKAHWPAEEADAALTSIAIDADNVFVADAHPRHRVVLRYDKAGKLLGRIGRRDRERNIPGLVVPSRYLDVAIAPDGLLRVVNPGECRVETYTYGGDREASWGVAGSGIEQFTGCCNPVNITIGPEGRVITCEKGLRRVKLYDAGGEFLGVIAPPSAFATVAPKGREVRELEAVVDRAGRVLVLDPYDAKIRVFTPKTAAAEGGK